MAAPPPPRAVFRSSRTAQAALGAFVLCVLAVVAYRTYFPRLSARPTDDATSPAATAAPPLKPVDLNTADRAELLQLPGVGPSLADAILSHRREVGPFFRVDDLNAVSGVGDKTVDRLRPHLAVSDPPAEKLERKPTPVVAGKGGKVQPGEPPIDVNTASEAELMRLPRVGPVLAKAVIAARPFKSVDDLDRASGIGKKTLDALRPFVTAGENNHPNR